MAHTMMIFDRLCVVRCCTAELAEGAASSTAIAFEVDEWSIEYGSPPVLWLKSKRAWYAQPRPGRGRIGTSPAR